VPTLVLDDGRPLVESNAILNYLAEGTGYLPTDAYERAQACGWEFFAQYEIEPNPAVARFLTRFGVLASVAFRAQRCADGITGLKALERGLSGREWLVGCPHTVADISLYAYVHVAHEGGLTSHRSPPSPPGWRGSPPSPDTSRSTRPKLSRLRDTTRLWIVSISG
jgi:glutathione S-transferase